MYGKRKSRGDVGAKELAPNAENKASRKPKTPQNQPWFPPGSSNTEAGDSAPKTKKSKKHVKQEAPSARKGTPENQIFVGGIGDMSEQRLLEHFSQFGSVLSAVVIKEITSDKSRGFGFVAFNDASGKQKALGMNHVIDDKPVDCRETDAKSKPTEKKEGWECFVGGLPKDVDAAALQNYFRRFGEVLGGRIMIDEKSQLSRGFGFVEFASKENISAVLDASHSIEGVTVSTKIAEPPKPKEDAPVASSNAIFLGGLPKLVPEQELREVCGQFGPVQDVIVKLDSVTGNCRGFAFVSFVKRKGFSKCLEAASNGSVLFQGRRLSARPARSKTSKESYSTKKGPNKRSTDANAGES